MQKLTLIIITLFCLTAKANDGKKTPSAIEAVTVYINGAQIKRTAIVNIKPGMNELLFNDLSPDINENSIQISGLKNTAILAMNFNIDYLEKKKNSEEVKALQQKINALLLQKNGRESLLLGLAQEQKVLENNQRINSDNTQLSLEKVKQVSAYYRERLTAINNERFKINKKIQEQSKELKNLQQELRKISANVKEQRGEIKLKIDAPTATNLGLIITYNINSAGWFPLYDIKAVSTSKPLDIAYKANVHQQTGSDWNNVNITLSTGDPNTNNTKPVVNPKYLNFVYNNYDLKKRQQPSAQRLSKMAHAEMEDEILEEVAVSAPKAYNATVTAKQEGITNTRFEITKKYTIASNAEVTVIEIDNFQMPADYEHYAAPEFNENVFLTAKLGNWEQYNLLAGEANIYFEGSYAGKTTIDPQATTDSLTVSLGVDPGIVVKRKQLDNFKSKSFIGATKIIDRGYEITIKNNKSVAINLILEDRIPVTQNKEIKIEDLQTGNANYDSKKGILKWKLKVESKQGAKKQFSYQVKYPKNQKINL